MTVVSVIEYVMPGAPVSTPAPDPRGPTRQRRCRPRRVDTEFVRQLLGPVLGVGVEAVLVARGVDGEESTLRHRPSGAYFVFGGHAGDYVTRYQAGDSPVEERTGLSQYRLMEQVGFWLAEIKRDIETPDLWAQLQGEAELLGAASDETVENTPFTPAEQEEIAGQLRELREYVRRTYSLSKSQTRFLEERLDYLPEASNRVGRKDWLLMAAGVMLTYFLEAALRRRRRETFSGRSLEASGTSWGRVP
jgi:hypothetical protein